MNEKVEKQKEHFEALADEYFEAMNHPNFLAYYDTVWGYLISNHPEILPHGARVLEPMCGQGVIRQYCADLLHDDFEYAGFDYCEGLVELAKKAHPTLNIFHQDVTTYEAEEEYDLIFLAGGLHHVHEQTCDVLKRLHRALKPGGYMLSSEPTYNNFLTGYFGDLVYRKHDKFDDNSEQRYALDTINQHFHDAGFSIVEQIYPGLIAYVIAFSAFCFPRVRYEVPLLVKGLVKIERPLYHMWLGRKLSFAAFTLLQKK